MPHYILRCAGDRETVADQPCVQMVMADTSRLVSPHGVPLDAHLTYHPFTPTWLTSTAGSVRTVADVSKFIIKCHLSSGSRIFRNEGKNHEICKTAFACHFFNYRTKGQ